MRPIDWFVWGLLWLAAAGVVVAGAALGGAAGALSGAAFVVSWILWRNL